MLKVVHSIKEMRNATKQLHGLNKSVGLVPTMGAFHKGHLQLMRTARKENDVVVVSLFVNPIQFGPQEDYQKYPRVFEHDLKLAKTEEVDILFVPNKEEMYPSPFRTYIEVNEITDKLCGANRPGHFKGVTTVVGKLLNIINPDKVYFGEKDFQQLVVVKQMVKDLNFPVKIVSIPTVREPDGLAMSSRNWYLNPKERQAAKLIREALLTGENVVKKKGVLASEKIKKKIMDVLAQSELIKVEYLSICRPDNFEELKKVTSQTLIAIAARVGSTRLIDNILINIK
jgi:pantoate--beta-alanine ligase